MSHKEENDCPVENATCIARMATLDEKIKGITKAIYTTGATITLILGAMEIALRFYKP